MKAGVFIGLCTTLSLFYVGCTSVESINDEVDISINEIEYITAGESKYIEGTIEGTNEINPNDIDIYIKDDYGDIIDKEDFYIERLSISPSTSIDLRNDLELKIVTKSSACNGSYFLSINVEGEGTNKSFKAIPFVIIEGYDCNETPLATFVLEAGANENTELGSSIDFDGKKVYLMSEAASKVAKIDLCYAYSGTNKVEKIGTPYWAYKSDYDFAKDWGESAPNIKFYKVSMSKDEFKDIISVEELEDMWDPSLASESSYEVSTGDVFMLETTEDVIALILIEDQEKGTRGKITIKVAK